MSVFFAFGNRQSFSFKSIFPKNLICFIFLFLTKSTDGSQCNKEALICVDSQHFQECLSSNGQFVLSGTPTACISGRICDDSSGSAQCVEDAPQTTTQYSVTEPACSGAGVYPAPACYQYYTCIPFLWWWESQLETCPDNQYFDVGLKNCTTASLVDCQFRTPLPGVTPSTSSSTSSSSTSTATTASSAATSTTATTPKPQPPPVVVPSCTGPGKIQASSCYQYYECEQSGWRWTAKLKNCIVGHAFDTFQSTCRPDKFVDCQSRITTTVKTSAVTPVPPHIVVPLCFGPDTYPAFNCYQYYECVQVRSWWEARLVTCFKDYAFDIAWRQCRPRNVVDCHHRQTTLPQPVAPTPPINVEIPKCSGASKHPASQCHQYYECVSVWWWWEPQLKTCPKDQAFDSYRKKCDHIYVVDCHSHQMKPPAKPPGGVQPPRPPEVPPAKPPGASPARPPGAPPAKPPQPPHALVPKCYGPGRHPAFSCNQYYQCVHNHQWWEPKLLTCPSGHAFDLESQQCRPWTIVECHRRQPTHPNPNAPTPPINTKVPKCSGSSKHPAPKCREYYECISEWWWWKPQLKTCPGDDIFDIYSKTCKNVAVVDCQSRITTTIVPPSLTPKCLGPSRHPSYNCYQYYQCVQVQNWWEPRLFTCPPGHAFDLKNSQCQSLHLVDCYYRQPIHPNPSAPAPPVNTEPPKCSGPTKHPAPICHEYYECVSSWYWWVPQLKTCPQGQNFDIYRRTCISSANVNCQHRQITLTPPSQNVVPKCSGPSKHAAHKCYEYYECVSVWWWYEPYLKTCPENEVFDIYHRTCTRSAIVNCDTGVRPPHGMSPPVNPPGISPIRPPGVPPSGSPGVPPAGVPGVLPVPICSGPSKHPAPSCYYYYTCISIKGGWEPYLQACPKGQAFDIFQKRCIPSAHVDCQYRITTVVPTVPPSKGKPKCSSRGVHPGPSCHQFYECEQVWWWWEPKVKSCPPGEAFDVYHKTCTRAALVQCGTGVHPGTPPKEPPKKPKCFDRGSHPGPKCYQYYECQQILWWWEPKLLACPIGKAFDISSKTCTSSALINCGTLPRPPGGPPGVPPSGQPGVPLPRPPGIPQPGQPQLPPYSPPGVPPAIPPGIPPLRPPGFPLPGQPQLPPQRPPGISPGVPPGGQPGSPPAIPSTGIPTCFGPGKHPGPNHYQYYECTAVQWWWEPRLKTCPQGQTFDIYRTTCVQWTPSSPELSAPTCSGPSRHPASKCYQYYECVSVKWWWEPRLKTCPKGQSFDTFHRTCLTSSQVDCQYRTTWVPSPNVPKCNTAGKHPAGRCYQYYECKNGFRWTEAELKTCPDGEGYCHPQQKCVSSELIGCRLQIKVPNCKEYGKHPARKCYQYYECVRNLWWWTPELRNCPRGQGFSTSRRRCVKNPACRFSGNSADNSDQHSGESFSREDNSDEDSSKDR